MRSAGISLVLLLTAVIPGVHLQTAGKFWHITDLHVDPAYQVTDNSTAVCPSSRDPVLNPGPLGHYQCDAPWALIHSALNNMKRILKNPDFILWTGDDTPHVPDSALGEEAVLEIIKNLTDIITAAFPGVTVYSALGNHDFHPKNQLPPHNNSIYSRVGSMWQHWMAPESLGTFHKGAYYSEKLVGRAGQRIVVLNTNLYYASNVQTAGLADPAGQFDWLDKVLTNASANKEKVFIIGHVPPGMFEKLRGKAWFTEESNRRYVQLVLKHHAVIAGQFFGHHHTDSFRLFRDERGNAVSSMLIAPGITPWKTTLPGVDDGANNPGIRVFEYDKATLQLQDMLTHYIDLQTANSGNLDPVWSQEYSLRLDFSVPDASTAALDSLLQKMNADPDLFQKYYNFNSVSYDKRACDAACRDDHYCAIGEVDFDAYEGCVDLRSAAPPRAPLGPAIALLALSFTALG
ncbi:acid sphingomyelinase-like phosphodiesterase 3b [Petromyzon marinus]|uniref:Acid sphingomyelinase-like phosphodiesterase n=1 Tax=Petromyzon marinus TaxID=7757 RepID=A0AAJ7TGZ3_PETMA|nr:acid sphingomyelinase-like phosphodiesterase 3b [Petromyzon marinus]